MIDGFKKFILRGNVVDLAVGVVIGGAFGAITASLVADVITPTIGLIFGKPDFSSIVLAACADGKGGIMLGKFLNSVISFFLVSFAIYAFVVLPMNKFNEKFKKKEEVAPPAGPTKDQELLVEIRDLLRQNRV
ncbi:MAG: large conductance mechanosensitive channel protein MscL [Candidatus Sericytochromatia bacterium]|nr:large conductance mechanosensitive channel protein MscL [Candidatus Sericytochromatia bacterium]